MDAKKSGIRAGTGLMLILCPALGAAATVWDGLAVGIVTVLVLAVTEGILGLLRPVLPAGARTPVLLVTASSTAALLGRLIEAYLPSLHGTMGLYVPLAAVGCLLLDGAAFLRERPLGMRPLRTCALYILSLTGVGMICELLGSGTLFGDQAFHTALEPVGMLSKAPGVFLTLAFVLMAVNALGGKEDAG